MVTVMFAASALGCGGDATADAGGPADAAVDAAVDAAADAPRVVDPAVAARTVYQYLLGRFDSAAQAQSDPRFFAIQLVTCAVTAPELGALVMYVEQARLDTPTQPYRQRLYAVQPGDDGAVVSRVFELRRPERAVGLCDRATPAEYLAEEVIERDGCAVYLTPEGDRFVGGTRGEACASTLMGASYATSEVTLRADGMDSWDRGYNSTMRQVWGATAGAYRFLRRASK